MKVALVHSRYLSGEPSGENAVVDSEVAALRRAGIEVRLFERSSDDLASERLRRTKASLRVATGFGASPLADLEAWSPDIVHVHNLFPNFGTRWLGRVRPPIVHTVHNYRAVCASGLLFRDGHPCQDCLDQSRLSGLRHRCYRGSYAATAPLTLAQRRPLSRNPAFAAVDAVVVLAERTRKVLVAEGLPPGLIELWPNFISADRVRSMPDEQEERGPFVFLGRLVVPKGIVRLIERWPPGRRLVVIGDGPDAAEVRSAARGREEIELRGAVPRELALDALRSSAGLIIPSLSPEQFPMVYLEALATRTPVIAFDTNTAAELVDRDGTGLVCRWDDDLADALDRLRFGAAAFARAGTAAISQTYSEERYLERATELYERLIDQRRP